MTLSLDLLLSLCLAFCICSMFGACHVGDLDPLAFDAMQLGFLR